MSFSGCPGSKKLRKKRYETLLLSQAWCGTRSTEKLHDKQRMAAQPTRGVENEGCPSGVDASTSCSTRHLTLLAAFVSCVSIVVDAACNAGFERNGEYADTLLILVGSTFVKELGSVPERSHEEDMSEVSSLKSSVGFTAIDLFLCAGRLPSHVFPARTIMFCATATPLPPACPLFCSFLSLTATFPSSKHVTCCSSLPLLPPSPRPPKEPRLC
mmetsp:Transcript_83237/g.166568  ORF Transcript_83237/g.166568 Transcript_83237/m.166568 type:complete len:214 (+) Transcript_83237:212-853(+)